MAYDKIIQDQARDDIDSHIQDINRLALLIEPQEPRIFKLMQELTEIVDK